MNKKLLAVAVLVFVAAGVFAVRVMFSEEAKARRVYARCMQMKPGITLDDMKKAFGPVVGERAGKETGFYYFGSHEYSILYSVYMGAAVNTATGKVIQLSCSESHNAW